MPESIAAQKSFNADSHYFPWCSWHSHFHVSPLAVLSNLAVAHVRSPHGKRDHAIHRLISVNAAHARSPMANGDYATELLIRHTRPFAYGKRRLRELADPDKHSIIHTPQLTNGKQRPLQPAGWIISLCCRLSTPAPFRGGSAAARP